MEDNVKKSVLEGQMMETTKKINNNSQMFVKN